MSLSQLNSNEVEYLYGIANTPLSFYKMMRDNTFVNTVLYSYPTTELIQEFKERVKKPVSTAAELANIYAIFLAISLTQEKEALLFFEDAKNIKYEWFSALADIYIKNYDASFFYQEIENNQAYIPTTITSTPIPS